MNMWSPEVWDNISTVGLAVLMCVFLVVSYVRGWLIPGRHHREIVQARDAEIEQLRIGRQEDAATIRVLSTALSKQVVDDEEAAKMLANEELANRLLTGIKEALGK